MDCKSDSMRIRSKIKRNNRDIILRWPQIGCGSCFLQSSMGKQTEIGPPPSQDYDNEFPELLKQALFRYFVDCSAPFVINKELEGKNKCNLCQKYMVRPTRINGCNMHKFCRKCIVLWQELINNPYIGTLKDNHEEIAKVKVGDFGGK